MIDLNVIVQNIDAWLWGWPLVIFVIIVGTVLTLGLGFVQFRYFIRSWKYVLSPEAGRQTENYITPFQAFVNILSASIGNGSTAGMATAIVGGGPGAAFWVFVLGFLYMAIRYAEVYLSTALHEEISPGVIRGGPMVYLKKIPAGKYLAYGYAFFALGLSLIAGTGMQCNSIRLGIERLVSIPSIIIALLMFALVLYILFGGSKRIVRFSETIVPIKVGLFFVSTVIVFVYHYKAIIPAIKLILKYALTPGAFVGGLVGFSVQQAIRFAMARSMNSTEAGLGTAGIFYGATRTHDPVRSSIMSMATSFVSSHMVAFVLLLLFVVTGVWDSGLQSTQLTMAAYETVFGTLGGVIVAFLSITFGLGVLVAYAYIGRECWLYMTHGRYNNIFTALYAITSLFGTLSKVDLVWNATGIINAGLVAINLLALLYLFPFIRAGLLEWEKKKH